MATAKVRVYPYVTLNHKGDFVSVSAQGWQSDDSVGDNFIFMGLPMIELEIQYPDEEQLRAGAAQMLAGEMQKARTEFMAKMNALETIRNNMLRLAAPEVLDKADLRGQTAKPVGVPGEFGEGEDDDIPF